jgi:hypothetical protein
VQSNNARNFTWQLHIICMACILFIQVFFSFKKKLVFSISEKHLCIKNILLVVVFIGKFQAVKISSTSKQQKNKDGVINKKVHQLQLKAYLKTLITLHVEKKTLTKAKHFLLMDLHKVLNINEYKSNRILIKVIKHD